MLFGVQQIGPDLVTAQEAAIRGLRHSSSTDFPEQQRQQQGQQPRRRAQHLRPLDGPHVNREVQQQNSSSGPAALVGAEAVWAKLLTAREHRSCSSPPCEEGKHVHEEWSDFGEEMSHIEGAVVIRRPDLVQTFGISPARSLDYVATLKSHFPLFRSSLFSRFLLEEYDREWRLTDLHRFYKAVRSGNDSAGVFLSASYAETDAADKLASDGYESIPTVVSMADAFVSRHGFVWNGKDFVAPRAIYSRRHARHATTARLDNVESFEKIVVLAQPWGSMYYHFLVESLSRITVVLDILVGNPDIKVGVQTTENKEWKEYIYELLELLGIARERVVFVSHIHADLVILPPATVCRKTHVAMVSMLRHALLQALYPDTGGVAPTPARPVIVLIVRNTKRGIQNNDDVRSCGWNFIIPAIGIPGAHLEMQMDVDLKVREALEQNFPSYDVVEFLGEGSSRFQLETFATASIIVGPHGAGFSNMIVSRLHTPVLEIAPLRCPMGFLNLAVKLQHVYARHPVVDRPDYECGSWYEPPVDEVVGLVRDLLEAKRQVDSADLG